MDGWNGGQEKEWAIFSSWITWTMFYYFLCYYFFSYVVDVLFGLLLWLVQAYFPCCFFIFSANILNQKKMCEWIQCNSNGVENYIWYHFSWCNFYVFTLLTLKEPNNSGISCQKYTFFKSIRRSWEMREKTVASVNPT